MSHSNAMILKNLLIIFIYFFGSTQGQFFYLNTGVFKFIAGIGLPVNVGMSSGSLSWFNNMQVFYKLPDNITYYEPYETVHKRSIKSTLTRISLYQAFEKYLRGLGFIGNECLHRLICETAKRMINREENGLLGEIMDILIMPEDDGEPGLESHKKAREYGLQIGSRCGAVYKECTVNEGSIFLV